MAAIVPPDAEIADGSHDSRLRIVEIGLSESDPTVTAAGDAAAVVADQTNTMMY